MTRLKMLLSIGLFIAASTFLTVGNVQAKGEFGSDVNNFCQDSNPYSSNDCLLCHTANDKKDPTPAKGAYSSGQWCYFCPNDSACTGGPVDNDKDGFNSDADCNDNNPAINPGANETCDDSVDNDCNGLIDEQDPACGTVVCTDTDGDGYSEEGGACGLIDCVTTDPDIYPGALEVCNDGIDQDCSGKDKTKGKGCKVSRGKEGKGKTCSDGLDNDGDGAVDCSDNGCSSNRSCR